MILQTLLFPTPEICQAEELYYRQSGQEISRADTKTGSGYSTEK